MAQFNTKPIHIQIRDINHNLIQNATIKVIERKTNKILYNAKSPSGEIILDDIENLKDCYAFRVEIAHPHYKSIPKTNAPCIREANINKPHTLEFNYQDKLLVSNVYAEITDKRDSTHTNDTKDNAANTLETNNRDSTIQNNANNTISLPQENHTLIQQEAQAINHLQIYLKAYYNQDTIPNKEKQSNDKKQHHQKQKKETKWGYIVFDKDKDIDSTLKELTKDSTIPLIKLKEFTRISKEDCIPHTLHQKQYDTQELRESKIDNAESKTNTSHIQNNQASRDSKSTNNTNKDYLLGEEINIVFKEEWEDKQVRFFAYIESPKSDVSIDLELQDIDYIIIYDEDKEENLFANSTHITWQDIAIEVISFIPAVKGMRIAINIGKWGLKLLRASKYIPKKARRYVSKRLTIRDKKDKQNKKTESKPIKEVKLNTLPKDTQEAYHNYKAHKWQGMYKGQGKRATKKNEIRAGGTFYNRDSILPQKPDGTYKKFDVGNGRDSPRFVRDTQTGDVYYTPDHYKTFVKIIE